MAEQQSSERPTGKVAGWLKGLLTTVTGLCSGAVLMYASPLIDRVVKPAKPVANFAVQAQGLQVTFQNRSTGATEGWWDFGDGSALEPYVAGQDTVVHTYPRPGVYTGKLSLKNLLGEDNERTANVNLDNSSPALPVIDAFAVVPVGPAYAPATFHIVSEVKNADQCIWALGDRALEVCADVASAKDRNVTFERPGTYVIRLAAFSGKQGVEKSQIVRVAALPAGSATAVLKVTREAAQVVTRDTQRVVPVQFPGNTKETVQPLNKEVFADAGFLITSVQVVNAVHANGVKAELTPDRLKIKLSGQLVRPSGMLSALKAAPQAVIVLAMKQEQVKPATTHTPEMVAGMLSVPGSASLPIPKLASGWMMKQQKMSVELRDGERIVWQSAQVPASGTVLFQNRPCRVTAALVGDQVRVDLTSTGPGSGLTPVGN